MNALSPAKRKASSGTWKAAQGNISWKATQPPPKPESPAALGRRVMGDRWLDAPHIGLIDKLVVDACDGTLREQGYIGAMVILPPRHGKSWMISQFTPAWFLGTHPHLNVILASYEAEFAASWGRKARDILTEHGQKVFGISVRDDSHAANRWEVAGRGGGMVTAGIGGPVTGKGGQLLILDDPIKNAEEASSEVIREKHWEWYTSTFRTRLEPDGAILLLATRWHEDDLLGRLLAKMQTDPKTDRFRVLRLPALAETQAERDDWNKRHGQAMGERDPIGRKPGRPLWPVRYPLPALEAIRASTPSRTWGALFQGDPRIAEGAFFERLPKIVDAPPSPIIKTSRGWDLAATEANAKNKDPDWSAGGKIGLTANDQVVIMHVEETRDSPGAVEVLVKRTAKDDGHATSQRIEMVGADGKATVSRFVRLLRGYDVKGVPTGAHSKAERARSFAGHCYTGNVYLLRDPTWNERLLAQMRSFPFGTHDDMIDAIVTAFNDLGIVAGNQPALPDAPEGLIVEEFDHRIDLRTFRVWSVRPSMSAVVLFQMVPPDRPGLKDDRLHVLMEHHRQAELSPAFIEQVLAKTVGVCNGPDAEDWFIVDKAKPDPFEKACLKLVRSEGIQPAAVLLDPAHGVIVTNEAIRNKLVYVDTSCEVLRQALTTGLSFDKDGELVQDPFWEPVARALVGAVMRVFTLKTGRKGLSVLRPDPLTTPSQIAAVNPTDPPPQVGDPTPKPLKKYQPLPARHTSRVWRPQPMGVPRTPRPRD